MQDVISSTPSPAYTIYEISTSFVEGGFGVEVGSGVDVLVGTGVGKGVVEAVCKANTVPTRSVSRSNRPSGTRVAAFAGVTVDNDVLIVAAVCAGLILEEQLQVNNINSEICTSP